MEDISMRDKYATIGIIISRGWSTFKRPSILYINLLNYSDKTSSIKITSKEIERLQLVRMIAEGRLLLMNGKLSSDNRVSMEHDIKREEVVIRAARNVRKMLETNYGTGTDLVGHDIEAAELIVGILHQFGIDDAHVVTGWCCYDNKWDIEKYYDEHTWVEEQNKVYIDVTADQFNSGMFNEHKYTEVIIRNGLPYGMSYEEPEKCD